jgi:hypothetical protein
VSGNALRASLIGLVVGVVVFSALFAVAPLLTGEPVIPEPVTEHVVEDCVADGDALACAARTDTLPNPAPELGVPELVCIAEAADGGRWSACGWYDAAAEAWFVERYGAG